MDRSYVLKRGSKTTKPHSILTSVLLWPDAKYRYKEHQLLYSYHSLHQTVTATVSLLSQLFSSSLTKSHWWFCAESKDVCRAWFTHWDLKFKGLLIHFNTFPGEIQPFVIYSDTRQLFSTRDATDNDPRHHSSQAWRLEEWGRGWRGGGGRSEGEDGRQEGLRKWWKRCKLKKKGRWKGGTVC